MQQVDRDNPAGKDLFVAPRYFVQHIQDGKSPGAYLPTLEEAAARADLLWRTGDGCTQLLKDTETDEFWWRASGDDSWHAGQPGKN